MLGFGSSSARRRDGALTDGNRARSEARPVRTLKRLRIFGPDEQVYIAHDVPITAQLRGIAEAVIRKCDPAVADLSARTLYIDHQSPDGQFNRVRIGQRVYEARILDGDTLRVGVPAVAAGIVDWIDVASFIAGAVGSGIAGNAAYDAAKVALKGCWAVVSKRRDERNILDADEARDIALFAVVIALGIADPAQVKYVSRRQRYRDSDAECWAIELAITGSSSTDRERCEVWVRVSINQLNERVVESAILGAF